MTISQTNNTALTHPLTPFLKYLTMQGKIADTEFLGGVCHLGISVSLVAGSFSFSQSKSERRDVCMLILQLAIILAAAKVAGSLSVRLGQPRKIGAAVRPRQTPDRDRFRSLGIRIGQRDGNVGRIESNRRDPADVHRRAGNGYRTVQTNRKSRDFRRVGRHDHADGFRLSGRGPVKSHHAAVLVSGAFAFGDERKHLGPGPQRAESIKEPRRGRHSGRRRHRRCGGHPRLGVPDELGRRGRSFHGNHF